MLKPCVWCTPCAFGGAQATVFWTGPNIVSRTLTKAHLQAVRAVLQRKVLVWDNLHANDYDNGRRLYMGPYR